MTLTQVFPLTHAETRTFIRRQNVAPGARSWLIKNGFEAEGITPAISTSPLTAMLVFQVFIVDLPKIPAILLIFMNPQEATRDGRGSCAVTPVARLSESHQNGIKYPPLLPSRKPHQGGLRHGQSVRVSERSYTPLSRLSLYAGIASILYVLGTTFNMLLVDTWGRKPLVYSAARL